MERERKIPARYDCAEDFWTELAAWGELLLRACGGETAGGEERKAARRLWTQIWEKCGESLAAGMFFPLPYLMEAFELDEFGRRCLALALLPEIDRQFETLYVGLEPDGGGALTANLALRLCEEGPFPPEHALRTLSPEGPLLRYCMEERGFAGPSDLSRVLKPAGRILDFVLAGKWDRTGVTGLTLWQPSEEKPDGSGQTVKLTQQLFEFLNGTDEGESIIFELCGPAGVGRKTLACAVAASRGEPLLFAEGRFLGGDRGEEFRRALLREAILQRCPVCLSGLDATLEAARTDPEAEQFLTGLFDDLSHAVSCCFLITSLEWSPESCAGTWSVMPVSLPLPDLEESRALWSAFFARYRVEKTAERADELAGKYRFTPGQMLQALDEAAALARWEGRERIDEETLNLGCRSQLRHAFGEKARRVDAVFAWDDLILPNFSKELLMSACDQMKRRRQVYGTWGFGRRLAYGAGLSMLFSGPPGTGKTMAAQIVAGELGLELYKVDLAAVVSKYVGETEKNLGEIFREASRGQAVLFFDEADALFGKRTEVKDAHDKYNNMEAAYLLQKIEEYSGVSVLATNYLQNFDEAFKRRLKFIIDFPFPDAHYRLLLWRTVFPPETPLAEDVDWEYLAGQFELSGSAIKNVAVNAAFLAARAESAVGMPHLLTAIKRELYKSGKLLQREDFGAYYMLAE